MNRDWLEHGIEDAGSTRSVQLFRRSAESIEIAGRRRDEHRHRRHLVGKRQRRLREAQHEIGTGAPAPPQLLGIGGIDADRVSRRVERRDCFLEMRKGRRGEASEIDHVGSLLAEGARFAQDPLE